MKKYEILNLGERKIMNNIEATNYILSNIEDLKPLLKDQSYVNELLKGLDLFELNDYDYFDNIKITRIK